MELSVELISFLLLMAMLGGFVDTVAGGGGLITIPALIFSGVTPVQALATNKFQASFGSGFATWHFIRHGYVELKRVPWLVASVFVGASIGAIVVQYIDNQNLMTIIPVVLIVIALYTLFSKGLGETEKAAFFTDKQYAATVAPSIGFYDGFLGPGTGTFLAISHVKLLGMDFLQATGYAKVLNFTTNVASLTVFLLSGEIVFLYGVFMVVGQFLGARIGAKMVIKKGPSFIRQLTVLLCIVMSVTLLIRQYYGA